MKIVIVGDGKVGLTLVELLSAEDHNITVVDSNAKVLESMQEEFDVMAVHGHGATRSVLLEAEADTADLLIAATSSDEINLLSCLTAKKMGCKNTIARVRSPEYAEDINFLKQDLGLSFTINPEAACAREIYRLLQYPSFLGRERFAQGRVEIVRVKVEEGCMLDGIPLSKLYATAKIHVLVCAVDRNGEVTIPGGSFVIEKGDDLFITANTEDLATMIKNLGLASHKVTHVTLVGGSRLALYLAKRLIRSGVEVKIIEKDPARCLLLADILPEADIVEADGTDQEVLLSEGLDRTDAMVALTGIDEENIVLSIYAKQLGVRTVITKCNRTQYSDMFRKMGLHSVVSPKFTIAEEIVRYVRAMENSAGSSQMLTMHYIADGQAEAMEFEADTACATVGIPLAKLPLKPGILIACISRGFETIIPDGSTIIQPGDLVVVVTASQRINRLSDILAE